MDKTPMKIHEHEKSEIVPEKLKENPIDLMQEPEVTLTADIQQNQQNEEEKVEESKEEVEEEIQE